MSSSSSTAGRSSGGVGFGSVLFLVFLVLKLTGNIGWSWWWVAAPLWIGWGIFAAFLILFLIVFSIAKAFVR